MKDRIESIESKIKDLKKKKLNLERKNIHELAKLVIKCGLSDIDKTELAGLLLSAAHADEKDRGVWRQAGEKFLEPKHPTKTPEAAANSSTK